MCLWWCLHSRSYLHACLACACAKSHTNDIVLFSTSHSAHDMRSHRPAPGRQHLQAPLLAAAAIRTRKRPACACHARVSREQGRTRHQSCQEKLTRHALQLEGRARRQPHGQPQSAGACRIARSHRTGSHTARLASRAWARSSPHSLAHAAPAQRSRLQGPRPS